MNQKLKVEHLNTSLNSLRTLRSSFSHVFETLSNGLRADHGENEKEKFLVELQGLLNNVNVNLRDLQQSVNSLPIPTEPLDLGNTTCLSHETTQERKALYTQLVNSYKWTDKVHEYSSVAHTLLSENSLQRSHIQYSGNTMQRGRLQSNHNVPPLKVYSVINDIDRSYTDMKITMSRPLTSNAVVEINLSHVLKAAVAFRGLLMESVMVKAYGETLDLWTESRYQVFKKVTENANAAMLHFYSLTPMLPDVAVRAFMTWLHSYVSLFSEPCKRCGCHLHYISLLPPAWRDFLTLEPFHDECKQ